ncbi:MAG: carbon storage regulator CsrA [Candidatus Deferrimicrobiaceae bacterium]
MLVLTRKSGERLMIGDDVMITVLDVGRGQVRLGIKAPDGLKVYREEIHLRVIEENRRAAEAPGDFLPDWEGNGDED